MKYWELVRRVLMFLIGVLVLLSAALSYGTPVSEYILGLILVGVVPIDWILTKNASKANGIQNTN